ncbi:MAG: ABC transporter ATP-binding protein, partial [Thiomargarita sp.]|nr:ABC transporter ATP-binding protein [Thiomargarita sp.]
FSITRDTQGFAKVKLNFTQLALLKGVYLITIYLMCENAIHIYEYIDSPIKLKVHQKGLEIGVVSLSHTWAQI